MEQQTGNGNGNGSGMGNGRRTLVVYYSRTGNTEKVARELAKELNADIERIIDTKDRSGAIGYLVAGKETTQKVPAHIEGPKMDPSKYDLVIVGTPCWVFTMATPVLAYFIRQAGALPEVAFFLTHNGNFGKTFEDMAEAAGRRPKAKLAVLSKEVRREEYHARVREFVSELNGREPDKRTEEGALA